MPGGETCLPAGRLVDTKNNLNVFHLFNKSLTRNYIYVGLTDNVERRFNQHQLGKNKTTAAYKPFEIILVENFETRLEARKREKYLIRKW